METTTTLVNKKDYFLVSLIGAAFGLFSIPILNNLQLPFLSLDFTTYAVIVFSLVFLANIALWIAAQIAKFLPVVLQVAKFAAVGAFNTFLDWGILNLLIAATGIAAGVGYAIFKGISFIAANIGSFFWNKYWTFGKQNNTDSKEISSFLIVSIVGMLINIGLASLIVNLFGNSGIEEKRLANIGAAAATLASLVWNFLGYKFIVFKK